jgi:hypothetical protein
VIDAVEEDARDREAWVKEKPFQKARVTTLKLQDLLLGPVPVSMDVCRVPCLRRKYNDEQWHLKKQRQADQFKRIPYLQADIKVGSEAARVEHRTACVGSNHF